MTLVEAYASLAMDSPHGYCQGDPVRKLEWSVYDAAQLDDQPLSIHADHLPTAFPAGAIEQDNFLTRLRAQDSDGVV